VTAVRPRLAAFAAVLLLAQGLLGATCVDGKTPDCSDPNVQCGPDLDGSSADVAADAPADSDAALTVDASTSEASSDAEADADAPADAPDDG
jgi:hypothetical protein